MTEPSWQEALKSGKFEHTSEVYPEATLKILPDLLRPILQTPRLSRWILQRLVGLTLDFPCRCSEVSSLSEES